MTLPIGFAELLEFTQPLSDRFAHASTGLVHYFREIAYLTSPWRVGDGVRKLYFLGDKQIDLADIFVVSARSWLTSRLNAQHPTAEFSKFSLILQRYL